MLRERCLDEQCPREPWNRAGLSAAPEPIPGDRLGEVLEFDRRGLIAHLRKVGASALGVAMAGCAAIDMLTTVTATPRLQQPTSIPARPPGVPLRHGHRHPPLCRLQGVHGRMQVGEQDAARREYLDPPSEALTISLLD